MRSHKVFGCFGCPGDGEWDNENESRLMRMMEFTENKDEDSDDVYCSGLLTHAEKTKIMTTAKRMPCHQHL